MYCVERDSSGILLRVEKIKPEHIQGFSLIWEKAERVTGFMWDIEIPVKEASWLVGVNFSEYTWCDSCAEGGYYVPATTRSKNPNFSGYQLCSECAAEYDSRPLILEWVEGEKEE